VRAFAWVLLPLLVAACASEPSEPDPVQTKLSELETRTDHNSSSNAQLSQRLDDLQNSIRALQGRLDELEHNNEAMAKQQRDLYADLDKRIGGGAAAGGSAGGAATTDQAGSAAGGSSPSSTEQSVYGQAFDALKAGSYSVAITGFKDFLSNYPASSLADNAQYWLGEAYYVTHDYDSAGNAFRTVLRKWPDSRKAPDALLKLGYTQYEQKQYPAARATLTDVTRKYPGTDAAKLASDRLQRIPGQAAAAQGNSTSR
jgi:tol-pal system protein YbgF